MKERKQIKINFSNRWLYTLITLGIFIIVSVGVYAYGGNNPVFVGHTMNETLPPSGCSPGQFLQLGLTGNTLTGTTQKVNWTCANGGGGSSQWTTSAYGISYNGALQQGGAITMSDDIYSSGGSYSREIDIFNSDHYLSANSINGMTIGDVKRITLVSPEIKINGTVNINGTMNSYYTGGSSVQAIVSDGIITAQQATVNPANNGGPQNFVPSLGGNVLISGGNINLLNPSDTTSAIPGNVIITGGQITGGLTYTKGNVLLAPNYGYVGIGTLTPSQLLTVNGNVLATSFLYSSDIRLKKDIQPLTNSLEKIQELNGVSFEWKNNNQSEIGLIAQNVQQVFPQLVSTDNNGMESVQYGNLVPVLIEAIKEQQKEIDELKAELANR